MTTIDTAIYDQYKLQNHVEEKDPDALQQSDFLTLLTTQLKNQDPTSPMDNAEFMGQMAQFSTVQGISDLSDSFEKLANSLYSTQALQAASIVGKEALHDASNAELTEANPEIRGTFTLDTSTSQATVSVYSAQGELVRQINLGEKSHGVHDLIWDGLKQNGDSAEPGNYHFSVEYIGMNGEAHAATTSFFSRINSVDLNGGAVSLNMEGGTKLNLSAVSQIR